MSDSDQLLREGRTYQYEEGMLPPVRRPPSMRPWVILAGILVLISLGIEVFWPLPGRHGPLPECHSTQGAAIATSCEYRSKPSDEVFKKEGAVSSVFHHKEGE